MQCLDMLCRNNTELSHFLCVCSLWGGAFLDYKKFFEKIFKFMQPTSFHIRYRSVSAKMNVKGLVTMLENLIKRIIVAAIESFPINEAKKTELLRNIIKKQQGGK